MEIKVEQGSDEWLEKRHNLITATNVASILGFNNINSNIELLKNKITPIKEHISKTNLFKIWGTRFEEYARDIYEKTYKNKVRVPGLFIHNEHKWLGATPDGILDNGLLEIKCPIYKISNECPSNYYAQIQIQMEVTNTETCKLYQCLFKFYYDEEEYGMKDDRIKGIILLDGEVNYWYLDDSLLIDIKRDREWFDKHFLKIKSFKKTIDELRNEGYDIFINNINKCNYLKKGNKKQKTSMNLLYFHSINELYNSIKKKADPLIDYLDYYGTDKYLKEEDLRLLHKKDISWYVKKQRNVFKKEEVNKLDCYDIKSNVCKYNNSKIFIYSNLFKNTYEAMKNKINIITNSLFITNCNIVLRPDLLINTSTLNKLYNKNYKYKFYNVIDFKLSMSDKNYQDINYLKTISYIYNSLGLKYFILNKDKSLHLIEPSDMFFKPALNWIKQMKITGFNWKLTNLHRWELYPNLKNDNDINWVNMRNRFGKEVKDLSMLWYATEKSRVNLLKNGIKNWDNPKLDLKDLIFNKSEMVKKMINNKNEFSYEHLPIIGKSNYYYVDYESTNSLSSNKYNFKGNMVYLIGVGWEVNKEWNFKYFLAKDISKEEEIRIFKEFFNFIKEDYLIFHWAAHEQNEYKRVWEKNKNIFKFDKTKWIDLCYVFQEGRMFIKDVYSYKLKQVATKLFEYKMINTGWEKNSVDGQYALVYPLLMTEITNEINEDFTMKKIIKYNEIDCKVLWEINNFLKNYN